MSHMHLVLNLFNIPKIPGGLVPRSTESSPVDSDYCDCDVPLHASPVPESPSTLLLREALRPTSVSPRPLQAPALPVAAVPVVTAADIVDAGDVAELSRRINAGEIDANMHVDACPLLIYAVLRGQADIARALFKHGADPTARDSLSSTAQDYARWLGMGALAEMLSPAGSVAKTTPMPDLLQAIKGAQAPLTEHLVDKAIRAAAAQPATLNAAIAQENDRTIAICIARHLSAIHPDVAIRCLERLYACIGADMLTAQDWFGNTVLSSVAQHLGPVNPRLAATLLRAWPIHPDDLSQQDADGRTLPMVVTRDIGSKDPATAIALLRDWGMRREDLVKRERQNWTLPKFVVRYIGNTDPAAAIALLRSWRLTPDDLKSKTRDGWTLPRMVIAEMGTANPIEALTLLDAWGLTPDNI